jgi:hypothetical protein
MRRVRAWADTMDVHRGDKSGVVGFLPNDLVQYDEPAPF